MARWRRDRGLQLRMVVTVLLLALVYAAFIAVLAYLGVGTLLLLAIVAVLLVVQYLFSDRVVLAVMGARVVSEEEEPQLYQTLTRLSALAGMPRPKLAIVDSTIPNAFATGRSPRHSVLGLTSGLVRILNQEEIEAVMAHELSHVKNHDVMVITIASFLSTVALVIFRNWFLFGGGMRGGRDGDDRNLWFILPLVAAVVWAASYLLIRALSRYREYSADRGSAVMTGRPSHLASALAKISGLMARVPTKDLREVEGMNAFFIVPVVSGSSIFQLFASHPPVEARIEALERIEREMVR
jgi:heat shock protein HtpX